MNKNGEHNNVYANGLPKLSPEEMSIIYRDYLRDSAHIIKAISSSDVSQLHEATLKFWRDCFMDAARAYSSRKEIVFENTRKFSGEKLMRHVTLREILLLAMRKMEEYPNIISEEKIQESLESFLDFLEKGQCTEERHLAVFRYLAYVSRGVSEKINNNPIKNTSLL